ncbi:MAG TPA: DUF547 domain-containing protein [Lysobacter sp.]|nr:DUF547 domain-containing protein [Lysobacter sp.]
MVFGLGIPTGNAAPRAELWERWTAHDPSSTETIDHGAWARFLKAHVRALPDRVNRIAYAEVSDDDKKQLAGYIAALEATPISRYRRNEQFAYWINLYNAVTVKVVLDHYPVQSIRDIRISPGLHVFAPGPWGKKLIEVEGEKLSLDDIEHRILRPIWQDPRIHYAVCCAAVSCPHVRDEPYIGANVDTQLTIAARDYVNHERGVLLSGGRLVVSSIYKWYKDDFNGSDAGVIQHLRQYAKPELASALASLTRISDDRYDWALNDAGRAPDSQRPGWLPRWLP